MRLKWFDCLALICTALLIAQVNEGFTSGVITLLGRAASIEPFCFNRVGLWGCPCKLTWGFIKQFSKVPNPAMCRQSQALELEPHWISLFIWIKISLDTRSAKSEVALMNCFVLSYLQDQSPKAIEILTWERRSDSEKHFLQYQKVKLAISFADSFIFSNKGKVCTYTFKTWTNPECDSFTLSNKPQRKASQKFFFPCWQNKDACDSVEKKKNYVWSQGLIITFQTWLKRG